MWPTSLIFYKITAAQKSAFKKTWLLTHPAPENESTLNKEVKGGDVWIGFMPGPLHLQNLLDLRHCRYFQPVKARGEKKNETKLHKYLHKITLFNIESAFTFFAPSFRSCLQNHLGLDYLISMRIKCSSTTKCSHPAAEHWYILSWLIFFTTYFKCHVSFYCMFYMRIICCLTKTTLYNRFWISNGIFLTKQLI